MYKHREEHHPKLRNTCLYCGRIFDCGFNLKQHVVLHMNFKDDELFSCDICGFQAHTKYLIKQHVIYSHAKIQGDIVCEQCGKICKRLSDMVSIKDMIRDNKPNQYHIIAKSPTCAHNRASPRLRSLRPKVQMQQAAPMPQAYSLPEGSDRRVQGLREKIHDKGQAESSLPNSHERVFLYLVRILLIAVTPECLIGIFIASFVDASSSIHLDSM